MWIETKCTHCFSIGRHRPLPAARLISLALCAAIATASLGSLPGCGGCRKDAQEKDDKEKLAKKKKKKKPDFEFGSPIALPSDRRLAICFHKPGHWTNSVLAAKANNFDFLGDLEVAPIDSKGELIPLDGVPYYLSESREAALPKGQTKLLKSAFFVPDSRDRAFASFILTARKGGHRVFQTQHPLSAMPSYQYHFVVLAESPQRYLFLDKLASVRASWDSLDAGPPAVYYRVCLPKVGRRAPLPSEALFWTGIACLLWDDVEPGSLDADQQQALVDWLHWGGQLIISGPDTLDTLRESFLAAHLPAESTGAWELSEADFDQLNQFVQPSSGRPITRLVPAGKWSGVKLKLASQAEFVPGTGRLLAQRRVGRGRIVVSAVRLSDRQLVDWEGFDVMLNACLLRRPARQYYVGQEGETRLTWADRRLHRLDAAQICKLRYFSRDTGVRFAHYAADVLRAEHEPDPSYQYGPIPGVDAPATDTSAQATAGPGVAAWNSFSPVACKAREALQKAARVEIPGRMFVVLVLAAYLVLLVPSNWLVFQALGRVEWAWIAAPLISIACTLAVVRMARLDIGFARSLTEIAVIEIQTDYPRAHATRFTALYTSLATEYDFRHEDPGALVQPFPNVGNLENFRLLQARSTLHYRHGKDVSLAGYRVQSNTTGLVHSEQMVELEGPLLLVRNSRGQMQINNQTGLPLYGVGVMQRTDQGQLRTAWAEEMKPIGAAVLRFHTVSEDESDGRWWPEQREAEAVTRSKPKPGEFNLRELIDLAEEATGLGPGEYRLVGWTDKSLPGLHVNPAAPQARHAALVVAQLRYGKQGDPKPDVNTKADVVGSRQ